MAGEPLVRPLGRRGYRPPFADWTTYWPTVGGWWLIEESAPETGGLLLGPVAELYASGARMQDAYFDLAPATGTLGSGLWGVLSSFVDAVSGFPSIRLIALETSNLEDEYRVWTVISAPPFEDQFRSPVYEAQSDALRLADYPLLAFRLLNSQELAVELTEALPESYVVLFERVDAS